MGVTERDLRNASWILKKGELKSAQGQGLFTNFKKEGARRVNFIQISRGRKEGKGK